MLEYSKPASQDPPKALRYFLLGVVLVWSVALRGWFATAEPTHRGVYDERFSVRNVAHILETRSLTPENGFHPSLSYLPALPVLALSEAYAEVAGDERLRVLRVAPGTKIGRPGLADGLDFTPHGYRLARWVSTVLGALSILVTYVVARRVYDARVALLAAFLLAAVPWHLRQAAVFKPDIVLVLTIMLVFWLSLEAVEEPTWRRFIIVGVSVGLALAAKFNSVPVVVPLVVAVFARLRKDKVLFAKLAAAGVVSIVVFLALNPFVISEFAMFHKDFGDTLKDYGNKAAAGKMTMTKMLVNPFVWLVHEVFHGWVVGALAVLGLVVQAGIAFSKRVDQRTRMRHVMLLAFPVGYVVIYSLNSQNPLGWHNWIVLLPFTAIAAALVIIRGIEWLERRFPASKARRLATWSLVGFVVATSAHAAHRFAYDYVIPTTSERARLALRSRWRSGEQRLVYREKEVPDLLQGAFPFQKFVVSEAEALPDLRERSLDFADGEVFAASRLNGPRAEFYRRRMASYAAGVIEIESGWFEARGEDLVVVEHGWQRIGRSVDLELSASGVDREYAGTLPYLGPRRGFVSLELWLARNVGPAGVVTVGGVPVELVGERVRPGYILYLTPRLRIPAGREQPVAIRLPRTAGDEGPTFTIRMHRWQRRTAGK